jgi:uncharacterized membrane-anchored protein
MVLQVRRALTLALEQMSTGLALLVQQVSPEGSGANDRDPVEPSTLTSNENVIKAHPLPDHPLRHVLNNELHARPPVILSPPERISHLAIYSGEQGAAEDHAALVRLCVRYGVTPPHAGINHFSCDFGPFRLKWERHTEFVTYTFFVHGGIGEDPFSAPAIQEIARDWLTSCPAQCWSPLTLWCCPARCRFRPSTRLLATLLPRRDRQPRFRRGGASLH